MARASHKPSPVETYATGDTLRWDVRWVVKKQKAWHIIIKDFGNAFHEALPFYLKVKATGRHNVTLRCRNSGFPPPKELQPYWHKKKVITEVAVRGRKRRGGRPVQSTKRVVSYRDVYRAPLRRLNREGQWWCPYCMEMREFVSPRELPFIHPPVVTLHGLSPQPTEPGLYCPMCLVSTRDHNVRKHNPMAERF